MRVATTNGQRNEPQEYFFVDLSALLVPLPARLSLSLSTTSYNVVSFDVSSSSSFLSSFVCFRLCL